jgi:hypothetical protein
MNLSERDKRTLKIAGPVLGGILALFLIYNLVAGGAEDVASPPGPVLPPSSPLPSVSASISPSPSPSQVAVFAGRDPFSIPPGMAPTATATSTVSGTATGTSTATATATSTSTGTSTSTSTSSPNSPNGNGQDFTGRTIVLMSVFDRGGKDMAQVTVDNRPFTVEEGERFSQNFELLSVTGECGHFLHVEESFTLCTNAPK